MNESEVKNEKQNEGRRFSQEQYDMLKRCSDKKDITEWNERRKKNPNEDILLEGADLDNCHLKGVFLNTGQFKDDLGRGIAFTGKVYLDGASLSRANLEGAWLQRAYIRGCILRAYLRGAKLWYAHLEDTDLWRAHIENADFYGAHLQGALFNVAQVDGQTLIAQCEVDKHTDFAGVALRNACVEPGLRQLLEYNIRRIGWEKWYCNLQRLDWRGHALTDKYESSSEVELPKGKRILRRTAAKPVWLFWSISDYGRSTRRIIFTFFGLALIFANIYYHWGRIAPPGIVKNLFVDRNGIEVQWWLVPLRTLYFSIVTMTTLGFGDMYANAQSIWGHILLSFQVILGYVLLGALVTRFAVLFTAGGPAGKFSD